MNFGALLLVGFGGAFAIVWLVHYIPLFSTFFGRPFSPRLLACYTLGPFDVVITLILVAGAWIGLGTTITGISMMVYNVITGIGLSCGVIFIKKILRPKWKKRFNQIKENRQEVVIIGKRVKING